MSGTRMPENEELLLKLITSVANMLRGIFKVLEREQALTYEEHEYLRGLLSEIQDLIDKLSKKEPEKTAGETARKGGRVVKVSEETYRALEAIKEKMGLKSFDAAIFSAILSLLKGQGQEGKKS